MDIQQLEEINKSLHWLMFFCFVSGFQFAFSIWYLILRKTPPKESKPDFIQGLQDLHCFECEIEMPVKEKNGRLCCSNCGLYH